MAQRRAETVDLSLIVPCHNDGEFLLEAVASVERVAPDAAELIIVNDGSTEARTIEVLDGMRAAGYRVIDQSPSGLPAARNRGIELARGRYVLPLDADNRICGGFAEQAIRYLDEHPEVGVVYGDRLEFGNREGRVRVPDFDLDRILAGNYIDACAIYRKSLWTDCGGYDAALTTLEDWELWIAAAERGWRFHHLDAIAFEYRVRSDSLLWILTDPETWSRLLGRVMSKHAVLFLQALRNRDERLAQAATLLREGQAEFDAIRASATWRWSRWALDSRPIRRFGPILRSLAGRFGPP